MVQNILFVTNRSLVSMNGTVPNFNDVPIPAGGAGIFCARAAVDNIDIQDEDSGVITHVSPLTHGAFAAADLQPLLDSANDVLVFIHGTANDFSHSITRAAYNQKWLSQAGLPGVNSNYDVIAFSWPARDYVLKGLSAIFDGIGDYENDRGSAAASNGHIAQFLRMLYDIRGKIGGRRMHLLAHSMGCYALGGAVETLFGGPVPAQPLFDEAILAAGDEIATTFTAPHNGRMTNLHELAREITVYFNRGDIAMHLSGVVNFAWHLGYNGAPNMPDLKTFPKKVYDFVDCDALRDYISQAIDHTHQYYRESPTVRRDIAVSLAGQVPVRPHYDSNLNVYSLV